MQTKKHSLLESLLNTLVGFLISLLVQLLIYPMLNIPVTLFENVIITSVFTIVSIIRGYIIRRYFNSKT